MAPNPVLLVGYPVYDRAWILPTWFEHVEQRCHEVGVVPQYVFVGDPRDTDTFEVINDFVKTNNRQCYAAWAEESSPHRYVRQWNQTRYERMAYLRNTLLASVREISPQLFLSLDSDILLAPNSLDGAMDVLMRFRYDACGFKCYMTPAGLMAPSYSYLPADEMSLIRPDTDQVMLVDVIMAAKLMTPPAYSVDYGLHHFGEDIAWSKSARAAGLKLVWDGRYASKHVMTAEMLDEMDRRCGF